MAAKILVDFVQAGFYLLNKECCYMRAWVRKQSLERPFRCLTDEIMIKSDDDAETIKKFSHLADRPHPCINHSSNSVFGLVCPSCVFVFLSIINQETTPELCFRQLNCACVYTCMFLCLCMCVYACVWVRACVRVCVCVYVCTCSELHLYLCSFDVIMHWLSEQYTEGCMAWCYGRVRVSKRQSFEAFSLFTEASSSAIYCLSSAGKK